MLRFAEVGFARPLACCSFPPFLLQTLQLLEDINVGKAGDTLTERQQVGRAPQQGGWLPLRAVAFSLLLPCRGATTAPGGHRGMLPARQRPSSRRGVVPLASTLRPQPARLTTPPHLPCPLGFWPPLQEEIANVQKVVGALESSLLNLAEMIALFADY